MENRNKKSVVVNVRQCVTCLKFRRYYLKLSYGKPTVLEIMKILLYDRIVDLDGAIDPVICLFCFESLRRHHRLYQNCKNLHHPSAPEDDEGAAAGPRY